MSKIGRNQPCPCGSGKKYKKCCGQNAQAKALNEVAKIGPRWIEQLVDKTLEEALKVHQPSVINASFLAQLNWLCAVQDSTNLETVSVADNVELEDQELGVVAEIELDAADLEGSQDMNEAGDLIDVNQVSVALRDIDLATTNRRDKKLFSQLKLSLSQSTLEAFEVVEVLRGSGLKVKGCFSQRVFQINQPKEAECLEPMEWIFGRTLVFGRRAYLLKGWEKIAFKQRKALRKAVQDKLGNEELSLSWLRQNQSWLFEACQNHQTINVQESSV